MARPLDPTAPYRISIHNIGGYRYAGTQPAYHDPAAEKTKHKRIHWGTLYESNKGTSKNPIWEKRAIRFMPLCICASHFMCWQIGLWRSDITVCRLSLWCSVCNYIYTSKSHRRLLFFVGKALKHKEFLYLCRKYEYPFFPLLML